jgi:transposase
VNSRLDAEQRALRNRQIVAQYRDGMSTKAIAEHWQITPGRVVQILNAAGVAMA